MDNRSIQHAGRAGCISVCGARSRGERRCASAGAALALVRRSAAPPSRLRTGCLAARLALPRGTPCPPAAGERKSTPSPRLCSAPRAGPLARSPLFTLPARGTRQPPSHPEPPPADARMARAPVLAASRSRSVGRVACWFVCAGGGAVGRGASCSCARALARFASLPPSPAAGAPPAPGAPRPRAAPRSFRSISPPSCRTVLNVLYPSVTGSARSARLFPPWPPPSPSAPAAAAAAASGRPAASGCPPAAAAATAAASASPPAPGAETPVCCGAGSAAGAASAMAGARSSSSADCSQAVESSRSGGSGPLWTQRVRFFFFFFSYKISPPRLQW